LLSQLSEKSNKTVICTIHQPSTEILSSWHNLLLLANGEVIYCGKMTSLNEFLSSAYLSPQWSGANIVEHTLGLQVHVHTRSLLRDAWENSKGNWLSEVSVRPRSTASLSLSSSPTRIALPLVEEVRTVIQRHAVYFMRSPYGLRATLARPIMGAVIYGVVYYRRGNKLEATETWLVDGKLDPACYDVTMFHFFTALFVYLIIAAKIHELHHMKLYYLKEQVRFSLLLLPME
jgi:hypothetical protein